jgi:HK97 family phage portal protein
MARVHAADRQRLSARRPFAAHVRAVPQDPTFWARLGLRQEGVTLDRPFAQHPWVSAVIRSRVRLLSQAPWKIAQRASDDTLRDLPQHPLNEVFTRPNRSMTGTALWGLTQMWLDLLGECFWILERQTVADAPVRIWPWPGGSLWQPARLGPDGLPTTWILTKPDGQRVEYPLTSLVYFRFPDPYNPLRGVPPLVAATETLRADILADQYQVKFFENGATPSGFIRYPMPIQDDQADEALRAFEDRHKGATKRGKVGILSDGAEWIPNTTTNKDMEYLGLREWAKEIVLAAFNWPETALGQFSEQTFANGAAAARALLEDHMIPTWREREDTLDAQLFRFLRPEGLTGYFDEDRVPAAQVIREAKWDTVLKQKAAGVTLQESNRYLDLGLKPQPGWDQVWRPLNEVPQDVLMEPAPTPAPAAGAPTPPRPTPAAPAEPAPSGLAPNPERLAALDALLAKEEAEDAARFRAWDELAREALSVVTKQSRRQREARRSWRAWQLEVMRPSERPFSRAMLGYHEALWRDQMRRFNAVAAREAAFPGGRAKAFGPEDIDAILFDREVWDPRLRVLGRPLMEHALRLGGTFTENELGTQTFDVADPRVRAFLDERVRLLVRVNEATQQAVARELAEGFRLNETVQEIRGRLEGLGDAVSSPARALRIARTESTTMANAVRFQMGSASENDHGIWVSAADDQVRSSHGQAEADSMRTPVRLGAPFSNGLLHPGDPAAPAGETVNCRCAVMLTAGEDTGRGAPPNRIAAILAGQRNGHPHKEASAA